MKKVCLLFLFLFVFFFLSSCGTYTYKEVSDMKDEWLEKLMVRDEDMATLYCYFEEEDTVTFDEARKAMLHVKELFDELYE